MLKLLEYFTHYLSSLDWTFILTFIIMGYGLNSIPARMSLFRVTNVMINTRYRMVIFGILYGILIYFIRSYKIYQVEVLIQSFVFALVFHKVLVDKLINFISGIASGTKSGIK